MKGVEKLEKTPPGAVRDLTYYHFASQVIFHMGGDAWERWNPTMRDLLVQEQDQGKEENRGHQKGSWSPANDAQKKSWAGWARPRSAS